MLISVIPPEEGFYTMGKKIQKQAFRTKSVNLIEQAAPTVTDQAAPSVNYVYLSIEQAASTVNNVYLSKLPQL